MPTRKFLQRRGAALIMAAGYIVLISIFASSAGAAGKYITLHRFTGGAAGSAPFGLVFDEAGNLYGPFAGDPEDLCAVFKLTHDANGSWSESVLYRFRGHDGFTQAGLIFDTSGNLYGTTYTGGPAESGTVFELRPRADGRWSKTVLHNFCSLKNCADGAGAWDPLIFDAEGSLYGTTAQGGVGYGLVFKLTPSADGSWKETVLHRFNRTDGEFPTGQLLLDAQGNLYGTTEMGGAYLYGTVFELSPNPDGSWKEKVLHSFAGGNDGAAPFAGVIFDKAGRLYGTTVSGGGNTCGMFTCGTVFQLTRNAGGNWQEEVLHHFTGGWDGAIPYAGLTYGPARELYGTAESGGDLSACPSGCGVVFRLVPDSSHRWKETVVHAFYDHPGDDPVGGVIFDRARNLYGTTGGDHTATFGSIFKIAR